MKLLKKPTFTFPLILGLSSFCALYALPSSFDLRNIDGKSYINPVKNQNPYGTCYSFGTASAAEASYNYTMGLYGENRAIFSEAFIVWSLGQKYDGFPLEAEGDGGESTMDYLQAMVDYGIISNDLLPYTTEVMKAYIADENRHKLNYYWDAPKVKFAGWHRLPTNDVETMKQAMINFATLFSSVEVTQEGFADPKGVYTNNVNTPSYLYEHYDETPNHAISLVGWTDENAWILRNSWSDKWAYDGYMYIDFVSAEVALASAYLNYLPWNEYGFEDVSINNTSDISASSEDTGYQVVSRGIYKWANDNSSINNSANISATASEADRFTFVHGVYLWAGDNSSITNSGTITANATSQNNQATAYGIMLQGTTINNTGTISATASSTNANRATAYGIKHFSFDDESILTNDGTINSTAISENAWAYGIYSIDTQLVQNNGTITVKGDDYGVGIIGDGQRYAKTLIKNSGTIDVTANTNAYGITTRYADITNENNIITEATDANSKAYGIHAFTMEGMYEDIKVDVINSANVDTTSQNLAYGIYGEFIESITNSGTINANASSNNAYGLYATNVKSITNTGTITATSTNANSYALYLDKSTAYNNGTVNGITQVQNSSTLGGVGTFNGNVNLSSSTLSPGNSIGTLTINGNLTQDSASTLDIEISNTASDIVVVSGIANVDGSTLKINPTEYITNASYTSVLQSSQLNGTFNIDAPAVLATTFSQTSNTINLDVTRNSYESLGVTASQKSVGYALESQRASNSSDIQSVLNTFDNLRVGSFESALSELSPNLYASANYAILENSSYLNDTLNKHLQESKDINHKNINEWGVILASTSQTKAQNDISEYEQIATGAMLGVDKNIQDNLRLGFALSYTKQDIDEKSTPSSSDAKSYYGHLYLMHSYRDWYFTSSLALAKVDTTNERNISSLDRKASSDYSAFVYSLSGLAAYEHKISAFTFTPSLELSYAHLDSDSFNESGAQDLSLHVNSYNKEFLKSTLALDISHLKTKDSKYIRPNIHAKWVHEYLSDNDDISSNFIVSGASFNTTARKFYTNKGIFGGGFDIGFNENLSLDLSAETIFTSNSNTAYNLGAKFKFIY